jgi:hypothetical protein
MNLNTHRARLAGAWLAGAWLAGTLLALPLLVLSQPVAAAAAQTGTTTARWQAQKLNFSYTGFTTLYTCDGLEGKVREILLAFGARKDVTVRATGCTEPMNRPSRMAWVAVEFSSLAPVAGPAGSSPGAGAGAPAGDAVQASWSKVQLSPNQPFFMGAGECELVEQMRDVLKKGFALRNVDYRVSCTPHQVSVADYTVTAEALMAPKK